MIGLSCALVLLLFMFGSLVAAAIPLLSAIFSVLAGLSLLGLLASAITFPTTAPTIATLLGLGVAVDYGLFLVARHREQLDAGMDTVASAGAGRRNLRRGDRHRRRHRRGLHSRPLRLRGAFVGSLGLASAIVVAITMLAALTLVPAFMGVAGENVRSLTAGCAPGGLA